MKKTIAIITLSLILFISVGTGTSPMLHPECEKQIGGHLEKSSDLQFQWNTNASCFVVSVFSFNRIYIDDIFYNTTLEVNGTHKTTWADVDGFFLTNGTWFGFVGFGAYETTYSGNLRYFHFDWGPFNYTHDNRITYNISGRYPVNQMHLQNRTLPPGKWYFVFTSAFFDLEHDIVFNRSIQMNFNDRCTDILVSTTAGGKVYALWYGEFDANLIISKSDVFETMVGGKYTFNVNNTFMYIFLRWPDSQGFWHIKWEKPDGSISKLNSVILQGYPYMQGDETCIEGMGPNGTYKLTTSYVDCKTLFPSSIYPAPIYFIGVDVKLP